MENQLVEKGESPLKLKSVLAVCLVRIVKNGKAAVLRHQLKSSSATCSEPAPKKRGSEEGRRGPVCWSFHWDNSLMGTSTPRC